MYFFVKVLMLAGAVVADGVDQGGSHMDDSGSAGGSGIPNTVQQQSNLPANLIVACGLSLSRELSASTIYTSSRSMAALADTLVFKNLFQIQPTTTPKDGLACLFTNYTFVPPPPGCRYLNFSAFRTEVEGLPTEPTPHRSCSVSGDHALEAAALINGGMTDNGTVFVNQRDSHFQIAETNAAFQWQNFMNQYAQMSILNAAQLSSAQINSILSGTDPRSSGQLTLTISETGEGGSFQSPSFDFATNIVKLPIRSPGVGTTVIMSPLDPVVIEEPASLFLRSATPQSVPNPSYSSSFPGQFLADGSIGAVLIDDALSMFLATVAKGNILDNPAGAGDPFSWQTHNAWMMGARILTGAFCAAGQPVGYEDNCIGGVNTFQAPLNRPAGPQFGTFGTATAPGYQGLIGQTELASATIMAILSNIALASSERKTVTAILYALNRIQTWTAYTIDKFFSDVYRYFHLYEPTYALAAKHMIVARGVNPHFYAINEGSNPTPAQTFTQVLDSIDPPAPGIICTTPAGSPPQTSFASAIPSVPNTFFGTLFNCPKPAGSAGAQYFTASLGITTSIGLHTSVEFRAADQPFNATTPTGSLVFRAGEDFTAPIPRLAGVQVKIPNIASSSSSFYMGVRKNWMPDSNLQNTWAPHLRVTKVTPNGFAPIFTSVTNYQVNFAVEDPSNPSSATYSWLVKITGMPDVNCVGTTCIVPLPLPGIELKNKRGYLSATLSRNISGNIVTMPTYYSVLPFLGSSTVAGVGGTFSNIYGASPNPWGHETVTYTHPTGQVIGNGLMQQWEMGQMQQGGGGLAGGGEMGGLQPGEGGEPPAPSIPGCGYNCSPP